MLNYNKMIGYYDDLSEDETSIDFSNDLIVTEIDNEKSLLHASFQRKNYPSVLLYIGYKASKVIVMDGKRIKILMPFYLDKFDCANVGYERNRPLFLKEDRYLRVIDQIISGDFSNCLDAF